MIKISEFNRVDYTFRDACEFMKLCGDGQTLLDNMIEFREKADEALKRDHESNGEDSFEEWTTNWRYEVSAYNVVFSSYSKLFNGE